jgi:hypothetical protein
MVGGATFKPSFGIGTYAAYFCADFACAPILDSVIFVDNRPNATIQNLTLPLREVTNGFPVPGGAWFRFSARKKEAILARVGVSMISSERACKMLRLKFRISTSRS